MRPSGNEKNGKSFQFPSPATTAIICSAAHSRSCGVWSKVTESLKRAVPSGTVGGRMATASIPCVFQTARNRDGLRVFADEHRNDLALRTKGVKTGLLQPSP